MCATEQCGCLSMHAAVNGTSGWLAEGAGFEPAVGY